MKTLEADEFYGIKEARQRFAEMVRRSHDLLQRFVITNRGKPEAVLISVDEYEELMEIVEELSNPALAQRIAEERASYATTGGTPFDEYRKERSQRRASPKDARPEKRAPRPK